MDISVFGIGKLGTAMLACFAHKSYKVIGVDVNKDYVDYLNNGKSPITEPYVQTYITENKSRIEATINAEYAIKNSDITFIIVPTPSKEDGSFSTQYVENTIVVIGNVLRDKSQYHLVVITSTVLPGDMEGFKDLLEKTAHKKVGKDTFGLCYNPEFIALGRIVYDTYNPDLILIGQSDEKAGKMLEDFTKTIVENRPDYHRMSFYNAELTKISINAYLTMKVNYANTIGEICEKMSGGNADAVLSAIGSDSRIGKKYLRAGLPCAGPCCPPEMRVQTANGLKSIKDVTIEDYVFTHKGRLRKVTQLFKRPYEGPLISLNIIGFSSLIKTTPDHPIYASKKLCSRRYKNVKTTNQVRMAEFKDYGPIDFINADDLKRGDRVIFPSIAPEKYLKGYKFSEFDEEGFKCLIKSAKKEQYKGFVYNLEVEEDNSYMLESGVVHNCLPRDARALINASWRFEVDFPLASAADFTNNYQKNRILQKLVDYVGDKDTIILSILGLSYKEDTPVIEESLSLYIAENFAERGHVVKVYDPMALDNAMKILCKYPQIQKAESISECLEGSTLCLIATPWPEFRGIYPKNFLDTMEDPMVMDIWGILPFNGNEGIKVIHIGRKDA